MLTNVGAVVDNLVDEDGGALVGRVNGVRTMAMTVIGMIYSFQACFRVIVRASRASEKKTEMTVAPSFFCDRLPYGTDVCCAILYW